MRFSIHRMTRRVASSNVKPIPTETTSARGIVISSIKTRYLSSTFVLDERSAISGIRRNGSFAFPYIPFDLISDYEIPRDLTFRCGSKQPRSTDSHFFPRELAACRCHRASRHRYPVINWSVGFDEF